MKLLKAFGKKSGILLLIIMVINIGYFGIAVIRRTPGVSISGELYNTMYETIKPKNFLVKLFDNPTRIDTKLEVSNKFARVYDTAYHEIEGDEMITAWSSSTTESNLHVIYLHGGGYVIGKSGMKNREKLMGQLIDNTSAKVTFFDYPVAPEAQYEETFDALHNAYKYLIETYPNDSYILAGDSAGGGLALAYAIDISQKDIKQPDKLVLFSPWLDITLSNPDIDAYMDKDLLLDQSVLIDAGRLYVGEGDSKDPRVSPIYGDMSGIGETLMLYGTHELLYPDAIKLQEISGEMDYEITFSFYDEMQHVWILNNMTEAKLALEEAYQFIRNDE